MQRTPILLFTYKRYQALKKTIKALQKNYGAQESDLYIFSDGPKTDQDVEKIKEVRTLLKSIAGFRNVYLTETLTNKGLAKSIIEGVSQVFQTNDSVIVLEDDLLTTPNFLMYMNEAIDYYKDSKKVFSISGYSFNLGYNGDTHNSTYFLNRGWSWGWATWKDRWQDVDWEVSDYNAFAKNTAHRKRFARGGSDLNAMLRKQMSGTLDSWAIRWFYHQLKTDSLTLYPVYSKVYNNGFDEYATHTKGSDKRYLPNLDSKHSTQFIFQKEVSIHKEYQRRFAKKMGILARLRSKIETILKK